MATRSDIEVVCGSDQLCAGLRQELKGQFMLCQIYMMLILTL